MYGSYLKFIATIIKGNLQIMLRRRMKVMKQIKKKCIAFIMVIAFVMSSANFIPASNEVVYATSVKSITGSSQVVCKKSAKIKIPSGFSNCVFSSSNRKVASVNSKGVLKALRLGVTKITLRSGKRVKNYTITVVPSSKKDVYLKQSIFVTGKSAQLKLASTKYDVSQVSLSREWVCDDDDFDKKCYCKKLLYEGTQLFDVGYGSWSKRIKLWSFSGESFIEYLIYADEWKDDLVRAGENISYKGVMMGVSPSECGKQGIKLYIDDQLIGDQMNYTPGTHVFKVKSGSYEYKKKVSLRYSIENILKTHNAEGVAADQKEVLDAVFQILDQIISDNMTEEQKVKAIHDYLIYHADYYSGNLNTRPGWSNAIKGVIMNHEGVCNSYALAFYTMAVAEGIPCKFISGTATNSRGSTGGHAWNQVQLNGIWYYIDCTWDDPTGGGHERTTYYLSESLWSNHSQEDARDLIKDSSYAWENFYITGEGWN